jgi:hypothetical protein
MDASLFPVATDNLSNAALLLSKTITEFDKMEAPSAADLLTVASLFSQMLAFSTIGSQTLHSQRLATILLLRRP